jgi:hypothetical protein
MGVLVGPVKSETVWVFGLVDEYARAYGQIVEEEAGNAAILQWTDEKAHSLACKHIKHVANGIVADPEPTPLLYSDLLPLPDGVGLGAGLRKHTIARWRQFATQAE